MKEKPEGCVGNAYVCALKMVVESTSPVRIEHEFLLQSGERRIYEVFGYPVFNNKGVLKFIIQYSIDITERKRNEIELLDYKNVLDNTWLRASDYSSRLLIIEGALPCLPLLL